ncbi:serine/threonine protein kinase [Nitrincola sp. MINF-07-Sa-05]|uniref:serine/threonine protein kinase n=1 Tax=Nitrincola salilacus TaxID=3400273 RepID=UPI003917C152
MNTVAPHPFETLTPEFILAAVESVGYFCDGHILALNSYENRVYQVGIDDQVPLIVKFYRPQRWSNEQILEEHQYCLELAEEELSVVAPMVDESGCTLHEYNGFRFALYVRRGGRAPELDNLEHLFVLGRTLGRIHLVGASKPFLHRPVLDCESFGYKSIEFVRDHFIPASLREAYATLAQDLMQMVEAAFAEVEDVRLIRVHGDCHGGNLLWRDETPHFVDFDDSRMAPAIQDLWMLLSSPERLEREQQLAEVIAGYTEFADFNPRELHLIEPLRTLRMLHYCAWLARRWEDPAFPHSFTFFNTERYWGEHILQLREQLFALREPVLRLM